MLKKYRLFIFPKSLQKECDYFDKCDYLGCDYYEWGRYFLYSQTCKKLSEAKKGVTILGNVTILINVTILEEVDFASKV